MITNVVTALRKFQVHNWSFARSRLAQHTHSAIMLVNIVIMYVYDHQFFLLANFHIYSSTAYLNMEVNRAFV